MSNYKISVIIPVYKVEKYLDRCIESVVGQTYKNLEIILIDDGSPDNCPKMCDDWAKKDNRIRVIHKENEGVSSARNYGIDIATGEYISFVDSDDIIHPKYYEIMLNNIGDADMVYCEYKKFDDKCDFDDSFDYDVETYIYNEIYSKAPFSYSEVWNKIIRFDILNDLRFKEGIKNAEDTLFSFELSNRCEKVVFVRYKLYGYFVRETGAVGSIDIEGRKDVVKVCKYMCDCISRTENKLLKDNLEAGLYYAYLNLYKACKNKKTSEFFESKSFLKNHLCRLLFSNSTITIKEKIALLLNLLK
ncbi:MAG: glycosyltransferase family 2 protein [Erysipelotrichia bacterium]|nr:glycosyltransferase family 2 protein [Erysipelotrichia bacterium]